MNRLALVALVVVSVAACRKEDDAFTADMKTICGAKGDPAMPPDMQRISALKSISTKIKTPEAARVLVTWSEVAPAQRAEVIAPALAKAKLRSCPFLE